MSLETSALKHDHPKINDVHSRSIILLFSTLAHLTRPFSALTLKNTGLRGANQSPAPSGSKLSESGRVNGSDSHLCLSQHMGNGLWWSLIFSSRLSGFCLQFGLWETAAHWRRREILHQFIERSGSREALWLCVHSKQTFVIDWQQPTSLHNIFKAGIGFQLLSVAGCTALNH